MPSKRRSSGTPASVAPKKPKVEEQEVMESEVLEVMENEVLAEEVVAPRESASSPVKGRARRKEKKQDDEDPDARFIGEPIPMEEAKKKWPKRYQNSKKPFVVVINPNDSSDEEKILQAKAHYTTAEVDRIIFKVNEDAHVKAEDGEDPYICRVVEMFQGVDGFLYFTAQWYYRARDTVIKQIAYLIDDKRVFFSEIQDDNPLECLIEKLNIARLPLDVDLNRKNASIPECNYYCDMMYLLPYSTFKNLPTDKSSDGNESSSSISSEVDVVEPSNEVTSARCLGKSDGEVKLLDMYSGCGAMSTGLCLGANQSGLNLVTKWAVDLNEYACKSLQLNHPETQVRNESAEDFLSLLKEWHKLCITFNLVESKDTVQEYSYLVAENEEGEDEEENDSDEGDDGEVFEVEKVLSICYGDPREMKKRGLYLKIRWKGYGEDEDTWEPIDGLGDCTERIREFVVEGFNSNLLPLPGDVDVLCGGPPCQGISGFNRFRDKDNPLKDEKNKQLLVYMDIVDFLKPKFVLMENVVDLIKFSNGFLGRYALARLIEMNYQVRLGMMAAGAYGLPQFRMRCFLWGAQPTEKLPQYPLPTHDVVVRGVIPIEFESHTVAYNEGHTVKLEKKLFLEDALSDLPDVGTYEKRDEMPYDKDPQTDFQRFIRLRKDEMTKCLSDGVSMRYNDVLYDHRPLELNSDDYKRVCRIPKRKGSNFRDLPGVRVREDNKVEWDPDVPRVYLDSGKPLVPDYAMTFVNGTSSKPFARLWWDETVPTVVTRAEPHNQAILHPIQDRVLTIRENARLQGFPDYYKLIGPIKERYIQVGNAVAVPVARALGHALALSFHKKSTEDPLIRLPVKFTRRFDSSSASEADSR